MAPTMGEGSFVMSELGSSTVLFDFIAVDTEKYVIEIQLIYFVLSSNNFVLELVNYGVEKIQAEYLYILSDKMWP